MCGGRVTSRLGLDWIGLESIRHVDARDGDRRRRRDDDDDDDDDDE